jgi:carbon storage regulator CsrA
MAKKTGCCVIERRIGEDIVVGDTRVRVTKIDRNRVKIAIIAPTDLDISREGGRGEPKPKS